MNANKILMVTGSEAGHRLEYNALFERIFHDSGLRLSKRPLKISDCLASAVLFSPMLEEHTFRFLIVAITRAIWGRKSVCLLFRPGEVSRAATVKHLVKRWLLKAMVQLPPISVLTIMPFALEPRFAEVADGWIYDPQLWDLPAYNDQSATQLSELLKSKARERKIVATIGSQSPDKGFQFFCDIWSGDSDIQDSYLFVSAGKVSSRSSAAATKFAAAGGLLIDRFITHDELIDLYNRASIIWSCYSPVYDQASGIFGRAVQSGKAALVRQGSYMEKLGQVLEHPTIALPWNDVPVGTELIESAMRIRTENRELVPQMRNKSLGVLGRAVGFELRLEA